MRMLYFLSITYRCHLHAKYVQAELSAATTPRSAPRANTEGSTDNDAAAADASPVTDAFQRNATATQSVAAPTTDAVPIVVTEAEMELRTTQAD